MAKAKETTGTTVEKRFYMGNAEFEHDVFKLQPANMRKNMGYNPASPLWEMIEHSHIYHSINSRGQKQVTCTPIGGHCHEVVVKETGGVPEIVSVGPPVVKRIKKEGNRRVPVWAPIAGDDHTHKVGYIRSEKIRPAKINKEFVKFQSSQRLAPPPVDGVVG